MDEVSERGTCHGRLHRGPRRWSDGTDGADRDRPVSGRASRSTRDDVNGHRRDVELLADRRQFDIDFRDSFFTRFVEVGAFLGLVGGTLGKVSMDVKLMMQTEVAEVYEPYAHGRGSSRNS